MSSTLEVGKKLVALCREGKNLDAIKTLYAPNVVSIEAEAHPPQPQRIEGIDAVRGKTEWWIANHTVHSAITEGPWPHGDKFIVYFKYEVTPKVGPMAGKKMTMEEAGLYTVKNAKITQEEFYYSMGG